MDCGSEEGNGKAMASTVVDQGGTNEGYMWCCGKWRKKGRDCNRHQKVHHDKPLACEAGEIYIGAPAYPRAPCTFRTAYPRELYKHYYSRHRIWAKLNQIPPPSGRCEHCDIEIGSRSNMARHRRKCEVLREQRTLGDVDS
ncbi:hypothetical protein BJ166DRAFT_57599 [Pestalotiopsis sp. NC0098]|nr:hypothetical protein BJ166DRAFT_57599 [Pestalotiopsis sp. NC0098]